MLALFSHRGRMASSSSSDRRSSGSGVRARISALSPAASVSAFSSTCTVFAESEVISQLANGTPMPDILAGICESVASRTASLAKRIPMVPDVTMSGGVAQNAGVRNALARQLGVEILFSPLAQFFGALGAARYAYEKLK